jgi:hypothetical protein
MILCLTRVQIFDFAFVHELYAYKEKLLTFLRHTQCSRYISQI